MSSKLADIRKPIDSEMAQFNVKFKESMISKVPLMDRITRFIVKRKGKQMRPMFVFLSAHISGSFSESTYIGASLIELLHTATLVHDDVVDDSMQRRGYFSLNALWKNKISVLVGDYLLSRGLLLALEKNEFELLKITSDAVRRMSEGELLQIEKARKLDITEEVYFEIISNKTASLIASCCAVGASSSGANNKQVELMREFGEKVGLAFQIKDDLMDLDENDTGKPKSIDIKEKKMTLPLIYALSNSDRSKKKRILNLIRKKSEDKEAVQEVVSFIRQSGGISYSLKHMERLKNEALESLAVFPKSIYKSSLIDLVEFSISRKK